MPIDRRRIRLLVVAVTGIGVVPWLAYLNFYPDALDAHAYFIAQAGHLYGGDWGRWDTFVYSPAFAQAIGPLQALGWDGFRTAWRLLELGGMTVMAGPWIGPLLFVHPATLEFNLGNIHPLLGLAIVAGFRWPAAWAFVLLTKVTPGVGLIWFAVRREWRRLGIALGVTAAIAAVSFAVDPIDWRSWFGLLASTPPPPDGSFVVITAPLWLRLAAAAAIVVWGARNDRRWTVVLAAWLALPSVWEHSLTMLLGLWWLRDRVPPRDQTGDVVTVPTLAPGLTDRSTS